MTSATVCTDDPAGSAPLIAHYTNAKAVIDILKQGALWASDARYLNDRAEVEYGRALVRKKLADAADAADPIKTKKYETLIEEATILFATSRPLVVCFSRARDSLSQWRGYGGEKMRFALEFDEAELRKTTKEQGFDLADCIYDPEDQEARIAELIARELSSWQGEKRRPGIGRLMRAEYLDRRHPKYIEAMAALREAAKETAEDKRKISKEHGALLWQMAEASALSMFQDELHKLLMLIKHPSFRSEREVRAAAEVDEDRDLEFRGSQRAIVPFIRLRFRNGEERGALRAVRVGPGSEYAEVKPVLEQLLFQNFYDGVTVPPTNCTYRD